MDVYEAVKSRRAVRGFTDEPVPRTVLERVLSAAAWAPSGSDIQPWNVYVLTGLQLAELIKSEWPDLPVIGFSGIVFSEAMEQFGW